MKNRLPIYDCIVIGGGPGGLTSALYLARFRRKVLLVDAGHSRALWIPRIRNLVGYPHGVTGVKLLSLLSSQLNQYQIPKLLGKAVVRRRRKSFEVSVGNKKISAKKVILATGMTDLNPKVENLAELRKSGLLVYCPICDGFEHREERLGLLVKDNKGLHKINFLQQVSPRLSIFKVRDFKVAPTYLKKMKDDRIKFYDGVIEELKANDNKSELEVKVQGLGRIVRVKSAYVGLGVKVDQTAIKSINKIKCTKEGFIRTDSHQETSVKGLFAVGDCVSAVSQVAVAVGHAAIAATKVHNDLLNSY